VGLVVCAGVGSGSNGYVWSVEMESWSESLSGNIEVGVSFVD
jgi:hypothetical protein